MNSNTPTLINDELLSSTVNTIIEDIMVALSTGYKNFIINRYFSNEREFIKFIGETIYYDTTMYAIQKNQKSLAKNKMQSNERIMQKKIVETKKTNMKTI